MQNQNSKFEILIEETCGGLGLSYQALKNKYKDYPICLMEYIEKEVDERIVEVRFDNHLATISLSFDKENNCDASFLFLDNTKDEELLISYLIESADYNFRKSCWALNNCFSKVKGSKDFTYFYFYK